MISEIQDSDIQLKIKIYLMNLKFYQMMESIKNKKQLIKIGFETKPCMTIDWDLTGMIDSNTFKRHLVFCLSGKSEDNQLSQTYMKQLFYSFKSGDFYSYINLESSLLTWHEKTQLSVRPEAPPLKQERQYDKQYLLNQLKIVLSKLSEIRQPAIITLVCNQSLSQKEISEIIDASRQRFKFQCTFFILSQMFESNLISFEKGITFLKIEQSDIQDITNYYNYFSKHLGLIYAELTIACLSGDILINSEVWECYDFSKYRHQLYYPLCTTFEDKIETLPLIYGCGDKQWKLGVQLMYKTLGGTQYKCQQILSLPTLQGMQKIFTFKPNTLYNSQYLYRGILFSNNPFNKVSSLNKGVKNN